MPSITSAFIQRFPLILSILALLAMVIVGCRTTQLIVVVIIDVQYITIVSAEFDVVFVNDK